MEIVRFKTGIKGFKRIKKEISNCDFFIDLTYGDSFSDIYGFKNLLIYLIPKMLALSTKTTCVLGPQTYGPFLNAYQN